MRPDACARRAVVAGLWGGILFLWPGRAAAAADQWETLPPVPFTYGVSAGGGLASDGAYLYAADFSGDADNDYIDLDDDLADDPGERLDALGLANGSVRLARFNPADHTWETMPTLNPGGVGGDAFSAGNLINPLFVAAGTLYYYQFRAGPNACAMYGYDLSQGLVGTWQTVWEKTLSDGLPISGNAGIVGLEHDGAPVLLHHLGGGEYRYARSDGFADGGVHTVLPADWGGGTYFPRNSGWAYDAQRDRLFILSGDVLKMWTHNDADYPGGSFLTTLPDGAHNVGIVTNLIPSLEDVFGWNPDGTAARTGTSLWGNSLSLVNQPSGVANGPNGEDTGDNVLYLVRGETTAAGWPFNEGRGIINNGHFARVFPATGTHQPLPDAPFLVGKGSTTVYHNGFVYLTQGDTRTVGEGGSLGGEGIRRPGKGFARFVVKPAAAPDTTPPRVLAVTPTGTAAVPVAAFDVTFSESMALDTLAAPGVVTVTGPDRAIALADIVPAGAGVYRLTFAEQAVNGLYTLRIEPTATDAAGNFLDQDNDGQPGETPDDAFTATLTLDIPPGAPDLVAENLRSPQHATAGAAVAVFWTTRNAGTAAPRGGWTAAVYLSDDAVLDPGDVRLGQATVTETVPGPGAEVGHHVLVHLPAAAVGGGHLIAVTDSEDSVAESVEGNNLLSAPIEVAPIPGPPAAVPHLFPGEYLEGVYGQPATGDVDGDGVSDLVTTYSVTDGSTRVYGVRSHRGLGDGTFGPGVFFASTTHTPQNLWAADFNADGYGDLLSNAGRDLYLLRGHGDGTFAESLLYSEWFSGIAIADFDGEGGPDAAVWYSGTGTVTFLMNDGAGNLAPGPSVTGVTTACSAGTPEPDGRAPLVTVNQTTRTVSLHRLDAGRAVATQSFSLDAEGVVPTGAAAGDLDNDGRTDLAVTDTQALFTAFRLLEDGSLADPERYSPGHAVTDPLLLDLDGDGTLDLVTRHQQGASLSLWHNHADARFAPAATGDTLTANGDFEQPDVTDPSALYTTPPEGFGWSIQNGTLEHVNSLWAGTSGTGNPDGADQSACLRGGAYIYQDAATRPGHWYELRFDHARDPADASAKGRVMLSSKSGSGTLLFSLDFTHDDPAATVADMRFCHPSVVFRAGDGLTRVRFSNVAGATVLDAITVRQLPEPPPVERRYTTGKLAVGLPLFNDFDGDARPDTLISGSSYAAVLLNTGDGTLDAGQAFRCGTAPVGLAVGDLDGAGDLDVVAAISDENAVAVLLDGTGYAATTYPAGDLPRSVALADLDGDGWNDILVADQNSHRLGVLMGLGEGRFAPETTYAAGSYPVGLAVGRFDGDEAPDVAVANLGGGDVSVFLGQGDGTFDEAVAYPVGAGPRPAAAGDLDGDGDLDIVVGNESGGSLTTLLGAGDGTFTALAAQGLAAGLAPQALQLGDFNGDNRLDVAVAASQANRVAVLLGNGDGTFTANTELTTPAMGFACQLAAADFTGDGHLDLATANSDGGCLTVFANDGAAGFTQGPWIAGRTPRILAAADVNHDGRPDLVSGNWTIGYGYAYIGDDLTLYLNHTGVSLSPDGSVAAPLAAVRLSFPQAMRTDSFAVGDDVLGFDGPAGPVDVTEAEWLNARTLELRFAPLTAPGAYILRLGTDILTQDGAPLPGPFTGRFTLTPPRVSGEIPDMTVWEGTLVVDGDVTVPAGSTLVVAPGAVVKILGRTTSISVAGELHVLGTAAEPAIFTSVSDDAGAPLGEDAGTPHPGDWEQLRILDGGVAWVDHARIRWGGDKSQASNGGAVRVDTGGRLCLSNSIIEDALHEGLLVWYAAQADVWNSVIRGCEWGVLSDQSAVLNMTNCTLDDNVVGVWGHRGIYNLTNTIISHSVQAGVNQHLTSTITLRHCNVWSAQGVNYQGLPDLTGQDGNLSTDPVYRDYPSSLHLGFLSPMIDAADGVAAPETDLYGLPRYDDPRTANTGTPTATGAYADLGACEFVENAPSDVDLVVTDVSGPAAATVGEIITVTWTVRNDGMAAAGGPRRDWLRLARDGVTVDLGVVEVTQSLAAGGQAQATAEVRIPPCTPGEWHIQVQANAFRDIFEGRNSANNRATSAQAVVLSAPLLAPGAGVDLAFAEGQTSAAVTLTVPAGEAWAVYARGAAASDYRLMGGLGRTPTVTAHDFAAEPWTGEDLLLGIPAADTGRTVLVVLERLAALAPATVSLEILSGDVTLVAAGVSRAAAGAALSVPLLGCGFADGMSAELLDARAGTAAQSVTVLSSFKALAVFDLAALPGGLYDLAVTAGGHTATLPEALEVTAAGTGPRFEVRLTVPDRVRYGRPYTMWLEYANVGDQEMPAPMVVINSYDTFDWRCPGCGRWERRRLYQLLAVNPYGPDPAILPPGFRHRLPIAFRAPDVAQFLWAVGAQEADSSPIDWPAMEPAMRPANPPADWPQRFADLTARLGNTWGTYLAALHDEARRRFAGGIAIPCVDRLFLGLANAPAYLAAGTLVDSDSGQALAGVPMQLFSEDARGPILLEAQSDAAGRFCFENIPATGLYEITADGYAVVEPITVELIASDRAGLVVRAAPNAVADPEPLLQNPGEQTVCSLARRADGLLAAAWVEDIRLAVALFNGYEWGPPAVVPDPALSLSRAAVLWLPAAGLRADPLQPDLALVYCRGAQNNSRLFVCWGQVATNLSIRWSEPAQLTFDAAGDHQPATVLSPDGDLLTVWLQQDTAAGDDDGDLYFHTGDIPDFSPAPTREQPPDPGRGSRLEIGPLQIARTKWVLPKEYAWLLCARQAPGKEFGASLEFWSTLHGTLNEGNCQIVGSLLRDAGLAFEIDSDAVPLKKAAFSGNEAWAILFTVPEGKAEYAFARYSGGGRGSMEVEVAPAFLKTLIKKGATGIISKIGKAVAKKNKPLGDMIVAHTDWFDRNFDADATLGMKIDMLARNVVNNGPNPFDLPDRGYVEIDPDLTVSATLKAILDKHTYLNGTLSGKFGCKIGLDFGPYPVPTIQPHGQIVGSAELELLPSVKFKSQEVRLPPSARDGEREDGEDDDADEVVVALPAGRTGLYEGTPLLPDTATNTWVEAGHAAAVCPAGETLVVFTRLVLDGGALRQQLLATSDTGDGFGEPVVLDDGPRLCGAPALVIAADGEPVVVYTAEPADALTAGADSVAVFEAFFGADIWWTRRVAGVWQAPQPLATQTGRDSEVSLAAAPDGRLAAAWLNMGEENPVLWVSLGGAGAWQAPEPVVIAPELGNARAGFDATGRPLVVWQQDKEYGNGNRASRAFVSRRFEEGWSAPVELLPPAAAARGAEEPELRAEARGKLSFLPKPPEECWKDADPEPEVGEDDPPEDPERPDPPPPDEPPGPEGEGDNARSNDPNEKDAPVGCGTLAGGRYVRPDQEFTFIIRFENVAAATAAAQEVTITDRLPDGMDWNTFRFGEVGIGEQVVADLAGSTGKTVEVVQESTGMTLRIEAAFDPQTGDVRWYLRCVDPSSPDGWPPDPADGFLPPNAAPPAGEGYVTYTLRPPPESLPDGQVVSGPHARIVFDYNDPIDTNSTTHTVDATTPATTAVRAWKSGAGNQVRLAAQGNDTGSGVAMFEVFADSARGRRLAGRGWQGAEAAFAGDWGAGYSLYVRAIDGVGNAEPVPAEPSATVRIPQWAFRLGVEGADAAELFIATDATAADGWDEGLDEDVTTRDADAWLEGPAGHDRLRYDVRPPAADVVWILRTGADTDDPRPTTHDLRSTTLSWNPAAIPANQHLWLVQLDDGQTPLPDSLIALRTQSTTEFADGATYALHLSDSLPASLPLAAGWNLLSLPLAPADPDPAKVFGPRAAGRLWAWQPAARAGGQFVRPDTIEAPHGYWVFADSATGLLVSGTPPAAGPVALDPGWNLVGVAVPSAMPAIRGLAPWAWAWQDGRYAPTTTLQPAVGYWLYWDAEAPAEVTLPPR